MVKVRGRSSFLFLICLSVLTPAAYPQSGGRKTGRSPSSLFQVSVTDEKTGEKRTGFIDKTGKLVIGFDRLPKATNYVGEFHEGRAVIDLTDEESRAPRGRTTLHVGYIDETGEVVIAPRYTNARDFSEGLAFVRRYGFQGFIDREGKEVVKVGDFYAGDFHEGLATVRSNAAQASRMKAWGYIDRSGRRSIEPQYAFADDFSEGLAGVETEGKVGFINRKGEMVIPPRFEPRKGTDALITVAAGHFSEGLACVKVGDSGYGYINKKGEFVIPPRFYRAQDFSEGLAWVVSNDLIIGWIDKAGHWVVTVDSRSLPAELSHIHTDASTDWRYSEGLVPFPAYSGGRVIYGYMNQKGEVVIRPKEIYRPGPFLGGVARVFFYESEPRGKTEHKHSGRTTDMLRETYGYIDKAGRVIWPAQ